MPGGGWESEPPVTSVEESLKAAQARHHAAATERPASAPPPARKVALITGATAGLGAEFTALLARDGFDVALVAHDVKRLELAADGIRKTFGVNAWAFAQDLARPDAAARLFDQLEAKEIRVHTLINNAG